MPAHLWRVCVRTTRTRPAVPAPGPARSRAGPRSPPRRAPPRRWTGGSLRRRTVCAPFRLCAGPGQASRRLSCPGPWAGISVSGFRQWPSESTVQACTGGLPKAHVRLSVARSTRGRTTCSPRLSRSQSSLSPHSPCSMVTARWLGARAAQNQRQSHAQSLTVVTIFLPIPSQYLQRGGR